ncbi:ACT domain-containing protein [Nocardioides acrostichi]|uniref:Amino acid-binding protein n=1 Tax=Nocardioides acrostichi TaxID=2784339 RepID=A0A930V435_9ACTN|nr:amino acid-binding protein [Nocardioides acrostichi]MBF4163486.1 amino acid-binding protein [Nocardioides acrostichi]
MSFLLRVELPDVPGSLGRVASAIGMAGGDIEAIEIVEKRSDGVAVDDVLLDVPSGVMPDTVVSACNGVDGVRVVWVSRYAAGGNLFMDLEAVEELTVSPSQALDKLVDLLPVTFRADWAARVHRADGVVYATGASPSDLSFVEIVRAKRIELPGDELNMVVAAHLDGNQTVLVGRRGGPDFVDSEVARVGHLTGLAASIYRADPSAEF